MRLYSYIVASDTGLAPNPFFGVCTLAYCKPRIRSTASECDYVVGIGPRCDGNPVVYAMRITEPPMSFPEYLQRFPRRERGSPEEEDTPWVLVSRDFIYWGDTGKRLPENLTAIVPDRQGHRSALNEPFIPDFIKWFKGERKKSDRSRRGMPSRGRRREC